MHNNSKRPTGNPPGISNKLDINDTTSTSQRQRLFATPQKQPVSTIFARSELNILCPASRIYELHKCGFNIITHWCDDLDTENKNHKVVKYVLLNKKEFSYG